MCLSTVYNEKREVLTKNVAAVTSENGRLVFSDILGRKVTVSGTIEKIDLMENEILVHEEKKSCNP
ncbi:MAG: CooT family nickel-binding protein [Eubacteriales bacterium]|nr:CooT family nickel-binding protein [Eubacteriales bacterium]